MYFRLRFVTFLLCLFGVVSVANAENEQLPPEGAYRLIFSDFENTSAGKFGYLRDSIQTMIASRLSSRDRISVVDTPLSDTKLASLKKSKISRERLSGELNADYLLSGALYGLSSGLNIQVTLLPLSEKGELLKFSVVSDATTSLLADVEKLTAQIAKEAFGQSETALPVAAKNKDLQGDSGFATAHPEAAYKKKIYAGAFTSLKGSGVQTIAHGAKRSIEIPLEMVAMTVGDVDRDGKEEILILSESELQLYGLTGEGVELLSKLALPKDKRNHAINMADVNGDGNLEIYISATKNLDVSSMIIFWSKDSGFTVAADKIPWYLRPILLTDEKWRLFGQKRGVKKIDFMQPGIYELELTEDFSVTQGKKVALPPGLNLFNFNYADLDGNGYPEIVVIDNLERMRVYNSSNELLWVSKRNFGGSSISIGPSQGDAANDSEPMGLTVDEESSREPIFVPNPVIVKDFDGDGSQEVIVNENEATILNFFYKLRIYESSKVVGLRWSGEAMEEVWRTGKYNGVISAYSFFSSNLGLTGMELGEKNTGNAGRLFIGHIPAKGTLRDLLPGNLDSELKVYELEFTKTAAEN